MTSKRALLILLATLLTCLTGTTTLRAQTLEGQVVLGETGPAAYATIYVPSTGMGTVTDQDGRYLLDVPRGQAEVEYSFLGYRTVKRQMVFNEVKRYAHDERLEEQPLNLNDVYVTPTGEDPALYILRKVAEKAKANRKRLKHYEVQKEYVFHAQDVDFLPAVLPKPVMWTINALLKAKHRGTIWEHCCTNEQVDARLSAQMVYDKGSIKYKNEKLLSATPTMNSKAREQLFKMAHEDPFDKLYGSETDYNEKTLKKGKCQYKLKGTIEENGQVIDVLVNENAGDEGSPAVSTLYVMEDNWCILRSEVVSNESRERTECREVSDGLYLPVSYLEEPTFASIDLNKMIEEYKAELEEEKRKGEKDVDPTERKIMERLERYAQKHGKFKPCVATSYSISYSNVQITK